MERWEAPLPLRSENEALLYWLEARAPRQGVTRAPEGGASEAAVIPAEPIRIDFPWPAWPPLPPEWDCGADLTRVFDGAEDEATLGGGSPFNVIHDAVWRRASNSTIQSNFAGVTRGIGVEVGDEAYWFPLAVMLWTEVSNQSIGGLRTAASYCPLTDTALHFDTGMDPLALPKNDDYAPAGLFNSNLSVGIEGRRAGESTAFNQMLGFGITGPESGSCLAPLPSILVEFSVWRNLHPESWVLHGDDDGGIFDYAERENPYEEYWRDDEERRAPIAREDDRLPGKQRVFGILAPGDPVVVPLQQSRFVHHTEASGIPIVVLRSAKTAIALVRRHPLSGESFRLRPVASSWRGFPLYEDDTAEPSLWSFDGVAVRGPAKGTRLAWMPSMSAFWFAWHAIYPESRFEEPPG